MSNLCIFINILHDRSNSEQDSNLAVRVFSKLNFQLEMHYDVSSRELALILEKARSLICSTALPFYSLTVFVGAHGTAEGLVMRDGVRVCVEEIMNHFMPCNCPALIGKPKMFFFQNCREFKYSHSVTRDRNIQQMVESAGDSMVALSTREGCLSLRTQQGSLFFQAVLCQIESTGVSHAPLSTLLTGIVDRVKRESVVLNNEYQTPQVFTSLTRQFYFNPPPPTANTEPFNYSSFFTCFHCRYSHKPTESCYPRTTPSFPVQLYNTPTAHPFNYSSYTSCLCSSHKYFN